MHTVDRLALKRFDRFVRERLKPAIQRARLPLTIHSWQVPGEPVPFEVAMQQRFTPFQVDTAWGAPWSTTWFRLTGRVPADWVIGDDSLEARFDLGFTGMPIQPEGLAYAVDGTIIEAVSPDNRSVRVGYSSGQTVEFYLEGAANPDTTGEGSFSWPTRYGVPEARELGELYVFRSAELVIRDVTVWSLWQDVLALRGMVDVLPTESPRRARVLHSLDALVDLVDPDDVRGTAAEGRESLKAILDEPAHASAHTVYAVGHAHIDSAWLWPTRETVRKVARTFSNALANMDTDPDFVFAASSAQQYAWLAEHYPDLFARVRKRVAEGRFVPVGSMWVESDTNLPGGESFARQLIHGKRYFREEFGVDTQDIWLPDSFGYSGALPQLARAAGARWFFGQKLSWNEVNRMPHHTFTWEGIDGSRVFAHFTPADRYDAKMSAHELAYAEQNFAEKAISDASLFAFGHGDGGGGPTREMIARAHRFADLEGMPRVRLGSPNDFFAETEGASAGRETWFGEMYLEFHRGTYTSQARCKRGNRRSEQLLREAELWAATAAVHAGFDYPYQDLERAWHLVLLNQFHDILTGTSIGWVHRQAEAEYAEVAATAERVIENALEAVSGRGERELTANASPFAQQGLAALAVGPAERKAAGVGVKHDADGGIALIGDRVRVHVLADGTIDSLQGDDGREAIAAGGRGNLLQLSRDTPTQWDAWDIDREYRRHEIDLLDVVQMSAQEDDGDGARVRIERSVGESRVLQELTVRNGDKSVDISTEVDWHERQRLLKLVFMLDVLADRSAAETQFGHVFRSTHTNTSWDAARFEVCAHRWVHVGEAGYGVAIANDSSYGHDISRCDLGGHTATRVGVSLVRAPLFPDPEADQGEHRFLTRIHPGAGIPDAIADGYAVNVPLRCWRGGVDVPPLVQVMGEGVIVESVKLAEDRSGDLIVRLYEAHGGRATGTVRVNAPHVDMSLTDLLEEELPEQDQVGRQVKNEITLTFRPFQIRTLRASLHPRPTSPKPVW